MSDTAGEFSDTVVVETSYQSTPVVAEVLRNETVSDTRTGGLRDEGELLLLSESQAGLLADQGRVREIGRVNPAVPTLTLSDERQADVRHVLDLLSSSMDWGSGFLDDEDVQAWNRVADAIGYPAVAVKTEHKPGSTYSYVLRPLVTCTSRLSTSEITATSKPGRAPKLEALNITCQLHEGHRGRHFSAEHGSRWWE